MKRISTVDKCPVISEADVFNSLWNHPDIGVYTAAANATFLAANERFCALVGFSEEELLNMTLYDLTTSGSDPSSTQKQECHTFEKSIIKKDGSIVWLKFKLSLAQDINDGIYHHVAVVHDITPYKNIERELYDAKEMLRGFFETTNALIAYLDTDFNFIRVNKKYADAGNHPPEFYIGKNHFDLYPYAENEELFRGVIDSGQSISYKAKPFEYKEFPELGITYWDWDLIPTKASDGSITGLIFSLVDVTERKKAEHASNAKSEYIANMSHELRTPLNVILSAIQLFDLYLKSDQPSKMDRISNHLKSMRQNCFRLLRLVNNLIDTTKIDANYYELKLGNYDLVNVIETLTLSVVDYVKNKDIQLTFETNIDKKITACDIDILERIMLNLLSNAIKFTDPGGKIQVKMIDKKDKIIISVKDNGVGIPEDKQSTIFERYKQVDQLLTRRHEGSGIGLSLTKSFIELIGGSISLISKYGVGSEFIIELPCNIFQETKELRKAMYSADNSKIAEKIVVELSDIYSIYAN